MTTHFNYSLQDFSMNNAKVLTGNSQPVPDFKCVNFINLYQSSALYECPKMCSVALV